MGSMLELQLGGSLPQGYDEGYLGVLGDEGLRALGVLGIGWYRGLGVEGVRSLGV